jgi:hypothetical protein
MRQDPRRHLDAQFNRANISHKDFEEAERYLVAYDETRSVVIQQALITAAVIAYARPFKQSNSGGASTPFLPAAATRALAVEEQELHQVILNLRDQAIAHSDFTKKATRRVQSFATGFVTLSRPFDITSELRNVPLFLQLVRSLLTYCRGCMFDLNRRITGQQAQT